MMMCNKLIIGLCINLMFSACTSTPTDIMTAEQTKNKDVLFHYSLMEGLRNAIYTGEVTIDELKSKGDFGMGTVEFLDGELVAINGIAYRILTDGSVEEVKGNPKIPFAAFTFFKADDSFEVDASTVPDADSLRAYIFQKLPSKNRFYAIKVEADFLDMNLGGAYKIDSTDYRPIAEILVKRPNYNRQNVKGTIVGFYYPPYMASLDLIPFHFHFISNDRKIGGHLLTGIFSKQSKIKIYIDLKNDLEMRLPSNPRFNVDWTIKKGQLNTY